MMLETSVLRSDADEPLVPSSLLLPRLSGFPDSYVNTLTTSLHSCLGDTSVYGVPVSQDGLLAEQVSITHDAQSLPLDIMK